ncbi:MAG: cation:proton antiporter [Candidatus Cloacimonetes bacterium HGW-Cloacimonetes-3]|jgi:multicomponent Na+:H+ antiporter subunit G|nr:MAG: cation:proton antiporter [Candidatus Cloacimonetes bacterium HGW-Cloacimonetes-3]
MIMLIASLITLLGALFLFLGSMGVLRMPDVYNRMQAGTKATTMGSMLSLIGVGIATPEWLPKLIILILFILFTNPISSHALARAAHFAGIKLTDISLRDNLKDDETEEKHDA